MTATFLIALLKKASIAFVITISSAGTLWWAANMVSF